MTTAEIITIGTELLLGETADTNTGVIARTLRDLGVNLYRSQTIGDNAARIANLLREALGRADFVITTGGLGPTVDDPTREAAASAAGVFLEYRPELWEQVKATIARYGRTPTENQKRQAYLPQFAIAIDNPVGTAPAFIVESGEKALVCLPGVPREMETLLRESVVPYLQKRFALTEVIRVRNLQVSGVGEGALDDRIGDLETLANPTVGLSAHSGIVTIRITAKAGSSPEANEMIGQVEADLRGRLGEDIFGADNDTLEDAALRAVSQQGWNLVCVEINTGGMLKRRLERSRNPVFLGGDICSNPDMNLEQILKETRHEKGALAALGVAVFPREMVAELTLITPQGIENRHLAYGGHPGNLSRWAVNLGLDWLRRSGSNGK